MRVSVIATVLNEGESIRRLMDSLVAQSRQPDEVVIVDGGSTDGTPEVIGEYADRLPLKLLIRPGANISQGRNYAVSEATGEIIASTDAGVRLDPDWLRNLVRRFDEKPETKMVAGFFVADPQTTFEMAMGATVLPHVDEINPATFLPSSRSVAFKRDAFLAAGGYPEWLDYCEDLILDFRLKWLFGPFAWAPDALVYFRPRETLGAFFKQYYRYARGDGKAGLWWRRHLIRYLTYLVATPLILAAAVISNPIWALLFIPGAAYMFWLPYKRLFRMLRGKPGRVWAEAIAWVPVIRVTGDIAKMIGYPIGLVWRLRNKPPNWRKL